MRSHDGDHTVSLRLAGIGLGCLGSSALLGVLYRSGPAGVDLRLHAVALSHRTDALIAAARVLTEGGGTAVIWLTVLLAALIFPQSAGRARWGHVLAVAAAAGAGIGARRLFSDVLQRARPPSTDWATGTSGYAFPSGHTTAATIGAGLLAWALARHLSHPTARTAVWAVWAVWAVAALWAVVVGLTRVLLGVHWPLDVVAGWLFGVGWLFAMAALVERARRRLPAPPSG